MLSSIKNGKLVIRSNQGLKIYDLPSVSPIQYGPDSNLIDFLPLSLSRIQDLRCMDLEWSNVSCYDLNYSYISVSRGIQVKIYDITTTRLIYHFTEDSKIEDIAIHPKSDYVATFCEESVSLWNLHTVEKVKQVLMNGHGFFTEKHLVLEQRHKNDRIYKFGLEEYDLEALRFDEAVIRVESCFNGCVVFTKSKIKILNFNEKTKDMECDFKMNSVLEAVDNVEHIAIAFANIFKVEGYDFYYSNNLIYYIQSDRIGYLSVDMQKVDLPDFCKLLGLLAKHSGKSSEVSSLEFVMESRKEKLIDLLNIWNSQQGNHKDVTLKVKTVFQNLLLYPVRIDVLDSFIRQLLKNRRVWLDLHVAKLGIVLLDETFFSLPNTNFKIYESAFKPTISAFLCFVVESLDDIVQSTLKYQNDPIMQLAISSKERVALCVEIVKHLESMNQKCCWVPKFTLKDSQ
eukprot:NODE_296_length_11478_cov_0.345197.p1 type:complete len:456 gc:universal NODE_296_length_11478_cov_0.345197:5314-6681(+)